ncbi:MAG: sulfatase [Bacteroidales bacterium]|nr:sulfatase [Bacteroidales bacterium]
MNYKNFTSIGITVLLSSGLGFTKELSAQQAKGKNSKSQQDKKRNVIFILTDDHRYDFIGFTGKIPWLETPNMDALAADGAYFQNAFVTTSLCSPSRASILTGMYSHVHTIVDNASPDPENLVYFPQYLQKAGYQTSFFGKWHMGDMDDFPRPGFNHWESFKGQGEYYNPTLNIDGKRISYRDSTYITDLLTDHAIDWLEERDKQTLFMYLSHKAVHSEFKPAKRHAGKYKNMKVPRPGTFYQTLSNEYQDLGWPEWVKEQRYSWHGVDYMYHSHPDFDEIVQQYCETLLAVDESIGKVMDYLKKEGLDESTLVIYMGDNGFSWGEHGLIDKRHFYEESVKVPLIVHCPEIFKGNRTILKQMVQNIDIAPTIMECAGLEKTNEMPGYSFIPLLKGEMTNWRDKIFYEYYWEMDFPMTPTMFGVRTDKYKYIRYYGIWDTNELYDIQNDPEEKYNLIGKPEYQDIAKELAEDIYEWLETTDGMQIPLKPTVRFPFGDYRHQRQY